MNEGAPLIYHGNGGFVGPSTMYIVQGQMERQASRQYPLEMLQVMGGVVNGNGSPGQGTPRRWQHKKDRQTNKPDNAFGYESDDSSLSSSASGSNKSCEKEISRSDGSTLSSPCIHPQESFAERNDGENLRQERASGAAPREWRARGRRDPRARRQAPERYLTAPYPFQVKFTPDDLLNGSKWDNLSQEIWDKFVKSQQSEDTFRKKMNLWRYLHNTIKTIFPRYGLYVVGSTMSGFGLESSDMDLCLHVRAQPQVPPRHHALLHLAHVLTYIKGLDPDAELIQAKVPILKFRDERHGLQVDLNCNNVVGIRNTNLLYCYSRMDWRVRPLVAITKLWARAHAINDARQRTLSSYALTLMVIHFLQCGAVPAVLPRAGDVAAGVTQRHNRSTLAELFLGLLKYYADFPWRQLAVSVRVRRVPLWEGRARAPDPTRWKLICVEEPFDLTNTAHSVYDPETFETIVAAFRDSHAHLAAGLRLRDAWPQR